MLQLDFFGKKAKNWYEEGAVPSEPFFVPRPGATEEDDGKSILFLVVYYVLLNNVLIKIKSLIPFHFCSKFREYIRIFGIRTQKKCNFFFDKSKNA